MTAIPSLYLKWDLYRSLVGSTQSDAQIAKAVFGNVEGAAILFSKLRYGDYGCTPDIANALVGVMNQRINPPPDKRISANDLALPVYEFAQKLIDAAGPLTNDQLDAAHQDLINKLVPEITPQNGPRLAIKRFSIDRMFEGILPSGGEGRVVFEPGRHTGQIIVEELAEDPVATYAFLTRDPRLVGNRLWDMTWGETVFWLPSPMRLNRAGTVLNLMPSPRPVQPLAGRFQVTAVLVFDGQALGSLDPRGAEATAGSLDESETVRFVTNARRLAKRKSSPIVIVTNEYDVTQPQVA
jgi:hypothetical protein